MNKYFIRLFNYDCYANHQIFDAVKRANLPEKPVQLMAHTLAAQQVWLNRCLLLPPAQVELWPALDAEHGDLTVLIDSNHSGWVKFLEGCTDSDFENIISYQNTRGDSWENRLSDIITQVTNHGTHHRAQIGKLLQFAGVENLPPTDYIFYIRQQ